MLISKSEQIFIFRSVLFLPMFFILNFNFLCGKMKFNYKFFFLIITRAMWLEKKIIRENEFRKECWFLDVPPKIYTHLTSLILSISFHHLFITFITPLSLLSLHFYLSQGIQSFLRKKKILKTIFWNILEFFLIFFL